MYVELKNINKNFGSFKASDNVSFGIEKGKLIGLLGPSGSGKTTILRMIAGLETPDSGDILIDGKRINDVQASKRGIGFVFQSYALFQYMTVFDNIAFGLKVQKKSKKEIHEKVMELVKLIGLEGLQNRYPSQLSGGQRQRVAFARALAPNPHLLLLDEPFAAIDAKVRHELRSWLKDMINKVGVTSIFVTHDQDEAIEVADEIIITNHGTIEQKGSPLEIYKNPKTSFVAQFIGQSTVLEGCRNLKGFDMKDIGEKVVIRPEFIKLSKKNEYKQYVSVTEEGKVTDISFRGSYLEIKVSVGNLILSAVRSLEEPPVEIGEDVDVLIYRVYTFDENKAYMLENSAMNDRNSVFI
ncbi:ABC transporter ATP-binding protein [Clostridium butyricum]|uniref:ABC-type quaternary amine transporter n=1 Tax=Clostridium butyricum E4 str. BoNT E BL5262 TaxID=632245 RepID=C4IIM5_CLOBU|nr:ABC transporter ATP-binding protein [Clostridium butyricum]EDT76971.1 sulfate/thiosulfate import ATP-binding protein CysA [Clostridium butyricum 5521]EEP54276.1 sulfate/thiosulfate import ATP-binding protein CysA [Clostridium butyricum E4 str. BoNT E BL5262]NFL31005.1 ABC transporter ATP-binding protein [Clostridium butyricum]NFS19998.1 ABC transporter ATP-binding protein [Clostridium butyricum]